MSDQSGRRNLRHTTCFDELAAALRAHAAGLYCAVTAVELLIGHTVWLRRNDFVDVFVCTVGEPTGETTRVWVDWPAAVRALESGRLPCSGSEAGLLRVAASLAEGILVDLGDALSSLDERNLVLVAEAVLRAGGVTASAGVGAGRGDRR